MLLNWKYDSVDNQSNDNVKVNNSTKKKKKRLITLQNWILLQLIVSMGCVVGYNNGNCKYTIVKDTCSWKYDSYNYIYIYFFLLDTIENIIVISNLSGCMPLSIVFTNFIALHIR